MNNYDLITVKTINGLYSFMVKILPLLNELLKPFEDKKLFKVDNSFISKASHISEFLRSQNYKTVIKLDEWEYRIHLHTTYFNASHKNIWLKISFAVSSGKYDHNNIWDSSGTRYIERSAWIGQNENGILKNLDINVEQYTGKSGEYYDVKKIETVLKEYDEAKTIFNQAVERLEVVLPSEIKSTFNINTKH